VDLGLFVKLMQLLLGFQQLLQVIGLMVAFSSSLLLPVVVPIMPT
jgi:hypothetical protein